MSRCTPYRDHVLLLTQGSGIFRRHSLHEEDPIFQSFQPLTINQLACINQSIIHFDHSAISKYYCKVPVIFYKLLSKVDENSSSNMVPEET
jgi:hypothetical protein